MNTIVSPWLMLIFMLYAIYFFVYRETRFVHTHGPLFFKQLM